MKTAPLPKDPLFEVELAIARRADELGRELGVDRTNVLEHWRHAEREVWEGYGRQRTAELETAH